MTELVEHKNVDEAINAVMQEVGYVQKQSSRELRYTYASEAAFIEALRPSMVRHGIYAKVRSVKKVYRSAYETKNGTNMFNTLIEGVVRFTHVSGTYSDCEATGEGSDTGDKSANKAMTGMYKYALRQTFMIETGDDPDQFSSDEMERKTSSKPSQAASQRSEVRATTPVPDTQKPLGASESGNSGNGAVKTAETLSDAFLPKDLKLAENVVLIKDSAKAAGKAVEIPAIMKVISGLDKDTKYSIGQVVTMLTGEAK